MAAPLADAPDHFLVRQHGPQGRAPVHRHIRLVGQPVVVDELPLLVLAQALRDRQLLDRLGLLLGLIEVAS